MSEEKDKKEQSQKKEECLLCQIAEETIKRLKEADKNKKIEQKTKKGNEN